MTDETYASYMREHEEEYARDRMKTDYESYGDALKTIQEQHRSILSKGLSTSNHYFYTLKGKQSGSEVGHIWLSTKPET